MLNLTGSKTWRGVAPYVGSGLGFTFASRTPSDFSDFTFGTRIYLAPTLGARIFLTRDIFLRLETRGMFVQVKYPNSFNREPLIEPGPPGMSTAVIPGGQGREWIVNGIHSFGLSVPFPWPF